MTARPDDVLLALTGLRGRRALFATPARKIVAEALKRFRLLDQGCLVEIGAGQGQLREWLPDGVRRRTLHTEPLVGGLAELHARFPEASAVLAQAEHLPLADGDAAGVVALCVLDILDDGAAVAAELRRVLAPGGLLFHFLDMNPNRGPVMSELHRAGVVPLPNVFSDPCRTPWTEDVFALQKQDLALIIDTLAAAGHKAHEALGMYLSVFREPPFDPDQGELCFRRLEEDVAVRSALRQLFSTAYQAADESQRQRFSSFRGMPLASTRHLAGLLHNLYGPGSGFEVVTSEIATAGVVVEGIASGAPRYRSLSVGHLRESDEPPATLLSSPAPQLAPNQALHELGMYLFVARRL